MKKHDIEPIDLVVVNLYPFEHTIAKPAARGSDREHRHRRPRHDPLGLQEPRDVGVVIDAGLSSRARRDADNMGATTSRCAAALPQKPSRHCRLRCRDRELSRAQLKNDARISAPSAAADPGAALWRKPASEGCLLSHARQARLATARQSRARNSPTTTSTMPMRPECIGEFDAKRTAACVIVKHANPCGVAGSRSVERLSQGVAPAIRSRPWRHHRRQSADRCRSRARHHAFSPK